MRSHSERFVVCGSQERGKILTAMRETSNAFYASAVQTRCHPFIEFCGLMNEYISVCTFAHQEGIDFTQANTHTGEALPVGVHHAVYLSEKLNCIYGPSLLTSPEVREAFIKGLFKNAFRLVPVEESGE
jgi:hypothetical protein